jgi:hypothetical protein
MTQHFLPCVIEGPKVNVALADGNDDPGLERVELCSHDRLGGALKLSKFNFDFFFLVF